MYQIDDMVVCGSNGVCQIIEIGSLAIMGKAARDRKFYTLRPSFDSSGRVYLPVDCDESSIRPMLTAAEVNHLLEEIPNLTCLEITDEKRREVEYKAAINSSDPFMLIRSLKTMNARRNNRLENGKKSTAIDERYSKIAEQRLYDEISLVLNITRDEAKAQIWQRM